LCRAPRLLVLLMVRSNFRLFDSGGFETLIFAALGCNGFRVFTVASAE
jgi:hypothetical protein